jgi:hypothetical protein
MENQDLSRRTLLKGGGAALAELTVESVRIQRDEPIPQPCSFITRCAAPRHGQPEKHNSN